MYYLRFRKAILISFICTIGMLVVCSYVGIAGEMELWGVNFLNQIRDDFLRVRDSLNFLRWGELNYPTTGAVVEFVLIVCLIAFIVGWIMWIVKTKRKITLVYVALLVLTSITVLFYAENFVPHIEGELNSGGVIAIFATICVSLLMIAMLALIVFSFLYDYRYTYFGHAISEESKVVEVIEERHVRKETVITERIVVAKSIDKKTKYKKAIKRSRAHDYVVVDADVPLYDEYVPTEIQYDADGKKIRVPRVPFAIKLEQSTPEIRAAYNEVKAYFMTYGFNSRISIAADTFRLHTKTYARISLSGKSLRINYAVDPKEFDGTTFPVSDAGNQKVYADIPSTLRVRSKLSIKRAKILIDLAAEADELKRKSDIVIIDYARQIINAEKRNDKN